MKRKIVTQITCMKCCIHAHAHECIHAQAQIMVIYCFNFAHIHLKRISGKLYLPYKKPGKQFNEIHLYMHQIAKKVKSEALNMKLLK
jgi:hypothetical protein